MNRQNSITDFAFVVDQLRSLICTFLHLQLYFKWKTLLVILFATDVFYYCWVCAEGNFCTSNSTLQQMWVALSM